MQLTESRSLKLLIYVGLVHCATELRFLVRAVILANIALFRAVICGARIHKELSVRVSFEEPAVVEDTLGRHFPVHTQCITSWKVGIYLPHIFKARLSIPQGFRFVVGERFSNDSALKNLARTGQYVLRYLPSYREAGMNTDFASAFRLGARIVMSLLLMYDESCADGCSGCHTQDPAAKGQTTRCSCGVAYTKTTNTTQTIILAPACRAAQQGRYYDRNPDAVDQEPMPPIAYGPVPAVSEEIRWAVQTFHSAGNIMNVDFSRPSMVSLIDLFGFRYYVPWSIAKSSKLMVFVLRWFTAGGAIFTRSNDYIFVHEGITEVPQRD